MTRFYAGWRYEPAFERFESQDEFIARLEERIREEAEAATGTVYEVKWNAATNVFDVRPRSES